MDSLTSKAGADTYNVNGGVLQQDRDTRYGLNPSNSHGNVNGSATLGGTIMFRSDKVRLIYFTGGSGTVPAYETVISNGSGSGLLIGVHSALNAAPTTPGSAMPASGYIRVTQWNGGAYTSGALTGITATCAADPVFGTYDRAGWIIVVGRDAANTNVSRLSNPTEDVFKGTWFYVGITDGTRSTTYQIPNNGDAMYFAGVQVETSSGSGVYEWWPVTTAPMTSYNLKTTGDVSKQCFIDPSTAQIRFGHDGTNSTGGQCPTSGRKIRIPNLFLQSCTAGAPTANAFSVITSRHYFYANGAGKWNMTGVSSAWRGNIVTNAYEVNATDSAICQNLTITSNATEAIFNNVCISNPSTETSGNNALTLSGMTGFTATDCVFSVGYYNALTKNGLSASNTAEATFDNCRFIGTGMPPTGAGSINCSIVDGLTFTNCYFSGRHVHSQSSNITVTDATTCGITPGDPLEASSSAAFISLQNKSTDFLYEDWIFEGTEILGKAELIFLAGASNNNKFRNMGSYASPISARGAVQYDASWTRSSSTITVTLTNHGFRTNDYIKIMYSTSTAATGTGQKAITVTGANTFTFTGAASGDASGTLTFFRTFCSTVASSTASTDNEFQNIFVEGAYSTSSATTTTTYNHTFLNIGAGIASSVSYSGIDMIARGVSASATIPGSTSAQYGHTFADGQVEASYAALGGTGKSWSRSGSTITVTSADHGIELASTRIRIYDPSDTTATVASTPWKYATPITKDTFIFTGTASGSTSGTISWEAPTDKLTLFMNEQSDTVQRYTIDSGTPAFTGAGALSAITVGDQITWEMPEYLINYTGFANMPIETGLAETLATQGAFRFMYDIAKDDGAFSGTFKNLSLILTATGGTSGAATMTFASTSSISAGDRVTGLGMPNDAYVVSVDSSTQITLSSNLLSNASGDYMFNHLPAETFTTNFKLKVRQITLTANTLSNSYISIPLTSNATTRAEVYPIVVAVQTQEVNLTNGVAGSRVWIYDEDSNTELVNEIVSTFPFNWTDTNPYVADRTIHLRVSYVDGASAKMFVDEIIGVATNSDPVLSYRLNQTDDTVYNANAIDGSTVTDVTINDGTMEIGINTGTISIGELYAYEMYWLFTEAGIRDYGQSIHAVDQANYRVTGMSLKNITSPEEPLSITGGWLVDSTTGKMADLLDLTGGSIFNAPDHIVPFATGSGVTPGDVTNIASAVWEDLDNSKTARTRLTTAAKQAKIAANK